MKSLPGEMFARDHEGFRVSATGVLRNARNFIVAKDKTAGESWGLDEMAKHLVELADRFYAGDLRVVDEFLQLYALDRNRPKTTPNTPTEAAASEKQHKETV